MYIGTRIEGFEFVLVMIGYGMGRGESGWENPSLFKNVEIGIT